MLDALTLKELLTSSRRGHTYSARVAYVGLGGVLLYEFWISIVAKVSMSQTSDYAEFGRRLFQIFVPLQMLLVLIAAIGSSAERIVRERRAGTLGILLSTPLGARAIVWAKWKASVLHAGYLLLAGVPALALCVYLGLGPLELVWSSTLTFALAVLGAAFGIRASAIAETVPKAILLASGYFVVYTFLPLAVVLMGGLPMIFLAPFINPLFAAMFMLFENPGSSLLSPAVWTGALLVSCGVAYWVLGRAATIMLVKQQRDSGAIPEALPARPSFLRRWFGPGREAPEREVWEQDPLLWKEYVTRPGSAWTARRCGSAAAYGLLILIPFWAFTQGRHLATFLFLEAGFVALALAAGITLFAPEKEGRRMELLLSTPLSTARLVLTKMAAGLLGPEALTSVGAALFLALAFSWWAGLSGVVVYAGVTFVFLLGVYVVGAWASLRANSVSAAFLQAGGLICALLLALPLCITLLAPPGTKGSSLPGYLYLLSCLNPVWVLEPLSANPAALLLALRHEAVARLLFFASLWGSGSLGLLAWMSFGADRSLGRR